MIHCKYYMIGNIWIKDMSLQGNVLKKCRVGVNVQTEH